MESRRVGVSDKRKVFPGSVAGSGKLSGDRLRGTEESRASSHWVGKASRVHFPQGFATPSLLSEFHCLQLNSL